MTWTSQTPSWSLRMCSRAITEQPGNRCFTDTFQSLSMQQYQCRLCKIVTWKKASIKQFISLFSRRWTRKSIVIGNTSICSLRETMSSKSWWCKCQSIIFNDLKRWFILCRSSLSGRHATANKALQLEWFYMSFHSEDCVEYVESGRQICNKTLESVAEYFKNIFNSQVADGSLAKKHKPQIKHHMRHEMHQALRKQNNKKVCHITEQHHESDSCHSRQSNTYYPHDYKWKDCNHRGDCHNYDKHEKKQKDTTPSDCGVKALKLCSMHGPKRNHTSEECYKNLKNQNRHQAHIKQNQ